MSFGGWNLCGCRVDFGAVGPGSGLPLVQFLFSKVSGIRVGSLSLHALPCVDAGISFKTYETIWRLSLSTHKVLRTPPPPELRDHGKTRQREHTELNVGEGAGKHCLLDVMAPLHA